MPGPFSRHEQVTTDERDVLRPKAMTVLCFHDIFQSGMLSAIRLGFFSTPKSLHLTFMPEKLESLQIAGLMEK